MCRHTRVVVLWVYCLSQDDGQLISAARQLHLYHHSSGSDLHFFVHMKLFNRQLHVVRRLITAVGIHKNITVWSDSANWVLTVQYTGVRSTGHGRDDEAARGTSMATPGHRISVGRSWWVNTQSSWRLAAAPIPKMAQPGPAAETGGRLWLVRRRRRSAAADGTARSRGVGRGGDMGACPPPVTVGQFFVTTPLVLCRVSIFQQIQF